MGLATVDANEAVASVAYRLSEVVALYPITPASPMGEHAEEWSVTGRANLWGDVPEVVELQSEGGAAGTLHGALQAGALATTFTASQGLLLMLPNLYKIAGELTPACLHVAARSVATHALSIFGDHSDVMAARTTGVAMLASGSPQEAADLAAIAHAATLRARVPFLHFFDGFRTSHEMQRVDIPDDDVLRSLFNGEAVAAHRARALSPEHPVVRGTAQNPDTFFQCREAANPFYDAVPDVVAETMGAFAGLTGRRYRPFDYVGHPEAERVLVLMGSGAECAHEVVDDLVAAGERVGLVKVRLYRPFAVERFLAALPSAVRSVAVLDRTKEPGATGEPLLLDVTAALVDGLASGAVAALPRIIGGRYGLSSKEFDPPMVRAVLAELAAAAPRRRFTVGITDDVTHRSLPVDPDHVVAERPGVRAAVCYGLGSDGTVSANKASIRIICDATSLAGQGHFVYDSKKSGAMTVSHLRFGPGPIRATYQVGQAGLVAVHDPGLLERVDVLERAAPGADVLLHLPGGPDGAWDRLPRRVQEGLIERGCRLHVIDAAEVAERAGLGRRINTVMQVCFFALLDVLPVDEAVEHIKASVRATWGRRGPEIVRRNEQAVDDALAGLRQVPVPAVATAPDRHRATVPDDAPDFVRRVTRLLLEGHGDRLPVSAFPPDGTWPTGTSRYERRAIATQIPIWDPDVCIQCNRCSMICPHTAIVARVFDPAAAADAPAAFQRRPERHTPELEGLDYTVQVAPDDCTGCGLCVEVCPAKDRTRPRHRAIDMRPAADHRDEQRVAWDFLRTVPEPPRTRIPHGPRTTPLLPARFEFSGACAGCGETPYIRTLTQLFGDHLVIANATGCSSIYGGNLPTTPYTTDAEGRGPAWSNSLFEDDAEFALGLRLGADALAARAAGALRTLAPSLPADLVARLAAPVDDDETRAARRRDVTELRALLAALDTPDAAALAAVADGLVPRAVWAVGGDGWAYDIGYGGLDHVLASERDVNVLVLDTEVYSNTGGQASKATPLGAAAKFASAGKQTRKKDLGLLAMSYGHVYVASVALQARSRQTLIALEEAAAHPGPSLVIAHCPCIAHGYDLAHSPTQQGRAVTSGAWPLYRYDPRRAARGEAPLVIDADPVSTPMREYMETEARFRMVELADPARFATLVRAAEDAVADRHALYEHLAAIRYPPHDADPEGSDG